MSVAVAVPRRRTLGLVAHQIRYEQLSFWRNPQSAVFTFAFPVVFVTILGALFHGGSGSAYFYGLSALGYYVPTIAALSVLGSCYGQLAVALAMRRQDGILKRVRATPLPAWVYFAGLLAHCVLVSAVDVTLIVLVGRLFGASLPANWPAVATVLVLGGACFCSLGVAVAALIRNAEAAPAVVQLLLFPLVFLSGTYLPIHSAVLNQVAGVLPVRPFNELLIAAFRGSAGISLSHVAVLAAWSVVAAAIGLRRFRWNPRPE